MRWKITGLGCNVCHMYILLCLMDSIVELVKRSVFIFPQRERERESPSTIYPITINSTPRQGECGMHSPQARSAYRTHITLLCRSALKSFMNISGCTEI